MDVPKMKTNTGLILIKQPFSSQLEIIQALSKLAHQQGLVNDIFLEKIVIREEEYPTGLELPIPVAIPHIEDGCQQPFVSIATLDQPVIFKSMDRSGDDIPVRIVFLFGITNPKEQLVVLRKFASAFSKKADMQKLLDATTSQDLLEELQQILEGYLVVAD